MPQLVIQPTCPSTRQPPSVRVAVTAGAPGRRSCATATPDSTVPVHIPRSSRSLSVSFFVAATVASGIACWVATNHVAPHAPASTSVTSRTTAAGAPAPPYACGPASPSSPAAPQASRWERGTTVRSTTSAAGRISSSASARASSTGGVAVAVVIRRA
jgi:hypothetical protein